MDEGNDFRGYDLWMEAGKVGLHVINKWPSNALKVVSKAKAPIKKWTHLFITYNGNAKVNGVEIYINGKKQEKATQQDSLSQTIITDKPLRLGRRFNTAQTNGAEIDDVRFYSRALTQQEVQVLFRIRSYFSYSCHRGKQPYQGTEGSSGHSLFRIKRPAVPTNFQTEENTDKSLADLRGKKLTSMIMGDNPPNKMRKTYLLMRADNMLPG